MNNDQRTGKKIKEPMPSAPTNPIYNPTILAMADATFFEWVKKHLIGPSMNQRYRNEGDLYNGCDGTVGAGWVPILDRLATDLITMGWDGSMSQIKEKFGSLRFYANEVGVPDELHEAFSERIIKAELESQTTCETCGEAGTLRTVGWHKTLCDVCQGK